MSKAAAAKIAVAGAGVRPAAGHFSKVKVEAGRAVGLLQEVLVRVLRLLRPRREPGAGDGLRGGYWSG